MIPFNFLGFCLNLGNKNGSNSVFSIVKPTKAHINSSAAKKSLGSILMKLAEEKKDIERKIVTGDYSGLKKKHKLVQPI
jgi:hypothetical protein